MNMSAAPKFFKDASLAPCLSIMLIMIAGSTGFFLVNWIASCPLGAFNQVLATSVIQRIGTIIRNKGMEPFQRSMDQNHCGRGPKLLI